MVKKAAVVLVAVCLVLFFGRNVLGGMAVSGMVRAVTGLRLDMNLNVDLFGSSVGVRGLKLYNPAGFSNSVMMDLPDLFVRYNLGALLGGKIHLQEVRLNLREFLVEKNEKGALNLDSLKFVQEKKRQGASPSQPGRKQEFKIDRLHLKVGKVVYKDYSNGGDPSVEEFNVNLNETYEGVSSPEMLASLVVARALTNTAIARLTHFDLGSLTRDLTGNIKKVTSRAVDAVNATITTGLDAGSKVLDSTKEATGKATDTLKRFLPVKKE